MLGGYWYSTPAAGECKGDARPADGSGCTWRTVKTEKYTNASCVTAKVDAAVEKCACELHYSVAFAHHVRHLNLL